MANPALDRHHRRGAAPRPASRPLPDRSPAGDAVSDPGIVADRWGRMMVAAQGGDDAVYDRLLAEISQWLHRFYRRRLQSHAAQDALQEALLAIHCKKHSYEDSGPFLPWLITVARYKWIDQLRQQYREPEPIENFELIVGDHESTVCSAIVLNDLLGRLKPAQAEAIRMTKLTGSSIAEACQATGQSPSLVKINVHRGLKRISRLLKIRNSPRSPIRQTLKTSPSTA